MGVTYSPILPSNSIDHSTLQQSFVDDLTLVKGAVSSRVSSLARSTEAFPFHNDSPQLTGPSGPSLG
jgi:hypothetical protein